jgi:predicted transcriptional regulator
MPVVSVGTLINLFGDGGRRGMKSVLISIRPKWCELIANGEKTVEVRKTKPKLEKPFKVYIYCTRGNGELIQRKGNKFLGYTETSVCGKVIGEFVCEKMLESFLNNNDGWFVEKGCLTPKEIDEYQGDKAILYGWHISDLVIYDKPKELSEFWTVKCTNKKVGCSQCYIKPNCITPITRRPQSWCYVEEVGDERN